MISIRMLKTFIWHKCVQKLSSHLVQLLSTNLKLRPTVLFSLFLCSGLFQFCQCCSHNNEYCLQRVPNKNDHPFLDWAHGIVYWNNWNWTLAHVPFASDRLVIIFFCCCHQTSKQLHEQRTHSMLWNSHLIFRWNVLKLADRKLVNKRLTAVQDDFKRLFVRSFFSQQQIQRATEF